jgi:hypothetical protein
MLEAMSGELWAVVVAISAWIAIVFTFNLACAPYRIARDKLGQAEAKLSLMAIEIEKLQAVAKPTGRALSAQQKASLATLLKQRLQGVETLNVLYAQTSAEASDFAVDIGDAVRAAGFRCTVHSGGMFDHDPRDRGVVIFATDASVSHAAEEIALLFLSFGFKAEARTTDEGGSGAFVYVARVV